MACVGLCFSAIGQRCRFPLIRKVNGVCGKAAPHRRCLDRHGFRRASLRRSISLSSRAAAAVGAVTVCGPAGIGSDCRANLATLAAALDTAHQKTRRRLRIWSNSNRYGSATSPFAAMMTMSWEKLDALYQLKLPSRTT